MRWVEPLESEAVLLLADDVDTDQIIPARFLKGTDRAGLGAGLFADWRARAADRQESAFPLDQPGAERARVLVVGRNFGCGSSREHAAWALVDRGFRAVVALDFADIFRSNALKNGLLPVQLAAADHAHLAAQVRPGATVTIALESCALTMPDGSVASFEVESFARHCLLHGIDELGYLLERDGEILSYERTRARERTR